MNNLIQYTKQFSEKISDKDKRNLKKVNILTTTGQLGGSILSASSAIKAAKTGSNIKFVPFISGAAIGGISSGVKLDYQTKLFKKYHPDVKNPTYKQVNDWIKKVKK